MKKFISLLLILSITLTAFYGCTSNSKSNSNTTSESSSTSSSSSAASSKNTSDNSKTTASSEAATKENFKIYDVDNDTLKIKEASTFTLNKDLSLNSKVESLTSEVMKIYFNGLEYKLTFKTTENKTIAVLNLIDNKSHSDPTSWYQKFQGSAGAVLPRDSPRRGCG